LYSFRYRPIKKKSNNIRGLISRWNSTIDNSPDIPSTKNMKAKKPIINLKSLDITNNTYNNTHNNTYNNTYNNNSYKYGSAFSSLSQLESKNSMNKSKEELNSSSFDDITTTNKNKRDNASNTIITMNLLFDNNKNEINENKKRSIEPMSPFSSVKVKVQNSGTDESQNMGNTDENKTSEFTSEASHVTEELLNMKKQKRIEKMLSGR